jgi:hybrid cluster-associated redox disulfide protein
MKITKEMTIEDIVNKYPETIKVFMQAGLGCLGCSAARFENIEQGAMVHGIDIDQLIADLNKVSEPESPKQ